MDDNKIKKARSLFFEGNKFLKKFLYLDAKNCYLEALNLFPERKSILFNLSITYFSLKDFKSAFLQIKKLIELGCQDIEVINLLVQIHLGEENLEDGLNFLRKISENQNNSSKEVLYGIALIFFYKKNFIESLNILEDLLKKDEQFYLAYSLIGLIYKEEDQLKSLEYLLKSIDKNKDYAQGYYLIGEAYKELGEAELAKNFYNKCLDLDKQNTRCLFEKSFILPVIYFDNEQLNNYRKCYEENLLEVEKEHCLNNINSIDFPSNQKFYLSYNNLDNLEIINKKTKVFRKVFNKINYASINSNTTYNLLSKIRIAFISEYFTDHTIGKLFQGLIMNLDRNKYEVIIFHSYKTKNGFIKNLLDFSNLKSIQLPRDFDQKIIVIEKENIDIIFYPDVGMSSDLYYLTYLRLAKIQITSWGHPETTGNESIDYFISSKLIEVENGQQHYSEELICLDHMPMYYFKPNTKTQINQFDISSTKKYACPQSLFKILPDFDVILKKILFLDKKSEIYFIKDKHSYWYKILLNRWKKNLIDIDRIHFVNKMTTDEFIDFCGRFKVLLDPIYFGAGNSFYESMVYGVPTVTMPNNFMRSRLVAGAYRQMKIENAPVVQNIDQYVGMCVELANNNNLNSDIRSQLVENSKKFLFENYNSINEFNFILEKLLLNKNAKNN